jgi:hypothetical protein
MNDRKERVGIHGTFHFRHFRSGMVLDERSVPNTIVNGGIAALAGLAIQSGTTAPFAYIAIGTSTTAVASSDAGLYGECTTGGGARGSAVVSRVTTDVTNDTAQLVRTFSFTTTSGYIVTEAAVFNTVTTSSGTMLCRQIFTPISVANPDTLEVTYKLDFDPI